MFFVNFTLRPEWLFVWSTLTFFLINELFCSKNKIFKWVGFELTAILSLQFTWLISQAITIVKSTAKNLLKIVLFDQPFRKNSMIRFNTDICIWLSPKQLHLNDSMRKIPKFHPISWCGNFTERHSFCRVSGKSPKTLSKLCLST